MGAVTTSTLAGVDHLGSLTADDLEVLAPHVAVVDVAEGDVLLAEGSDDAHLVALVVGAAEVVVDDDDGRERRLATVGSGDVLGEVSALTGARRTATVRATTPSTIVTLDRDGVALLTDRRPDVVSALAATARERLRDQELRAALDAVFDEPAGPALDRLLAGVSRRTLAPGEVLFRAGDADGDEAFVVLSGRLRVDRPGLDGAPVLAERGDVVGELAMLIPERPRVTTVTAVRTTDVAAVSEAAVTEASRLHPPAALSLARRAVRRSDQRLGQQQPSRGLVASVLAATPAGDDVARQLADVLVARARRRGRAMLFTDERLDALVRRPGTADVDDLDEPLAIRLEQVLDEAEASTRTVVHLATHPQGTWAARAAARADHVVVVADAGSGAAPAAALMADRDALALVDRPSTVVVVHRAGTVVPRDTRAWVEAFPGSAVLHVGDGSRRDLERVARHVEGREVSVTLSGGGARGLAHIGALATLVEQGVPVDRLGGVSIGSTIAAGWGMTLDADEATALARTGFRGVVDYTLPVTSLASGTRLSKNIRAIFGDLRLEDLWLPTTITTTNLTRAQADHHRTGEILPLMRASVSIPGVFPPVPIDGEQHIDGGVLDNLPIRDARAQNPTGTVIGIDVAPRRGPRAREGWDLETTGWEQVAHRIGRRKELKTPGIVTNILSALLVGATGARDAALADGVADGYLHLEMRGVGLLEFDDVETIVARGREVAAPIVEAWLDEHGSPWDA